MGSDLNGWAGKGEAGGWAATRLEPLYSGQLAEGATGRTKCWLEVCSDVHSASSTAPVRGEPGRGGKRTNAELSGGALRSGELVTETAASLPATACKDTNAV